VCLTAFGADYKCPEASRKKGTPGTSAIRGSVEIWGTKKVRIGKIGAENSEAKLPGFSSRGAVLTGKG